MAYYTHTVGRFLTAINFSCMFSSEPKEKMAHSKGIGKTPLLLKNIRDLFRSGRVEWLRHALVRMAERDIQTDEVVDAILQGKLIEEYPTTRPYPSGLVLGFVHNSPIHVVVAHNAHARLASVITVYVPDIIHFEADFKTRRKK